MPGPGGPTVGRANIRVAPDTSRFRRELGQSLEALERSLTVQIPTRIDTKKVAQDAARVKADVEAQLGQVRTSVQVQADTTAAAAEIRAAARGRTATIDVDVDRSALAHAQTLLSGLAQSTGRLAGGAAGVATIAGSLSALGAGAAAAVVPVVQLGTALAPAVGILATLPAAAGTAAAAVAPLAVALSGMGDALSAAITGDAEALAEAMEGLAPAAQDVVRAVSEMQPALADIRTQVQEGFFRPLVEPVEELGERLLPVLGRGMTDVSMAMGEAAAELASFAGSARTLDSLDALFASTARSVEAASDGVPGLLAGLRELGLVGLPFVERFSEAAADAAESFGRWATEAAESGEATRWIEDAIGVFQQLGSIASNVGGIISSVFTAAGDGGLLGTIERLTGELDDFFASAEGGAALEGVFEGLSSVGSALSPVITTLASGVGELAPMIGRLAEGFGPVLTRAIEGLVPALGELEPGLMDLLDGLGGAVDALVESGALEDMGTALSDIFTALSPLMPVLGELAGLLGGMLAEALIALAPGLQILAEEFAENLAPVLPELSESFGELMEAIAPLIPPLAEALVPIFEELPGLIEMMTAQTDSYTGALEKAQPAIIMIIGFLGRLIEIILRFIGWILRMVTRFYEWTLTMEETARRGGEAFRDLKERVLGFLQNIYNRGANLANGIRRVLQAAFHAAVTYVVSRFDWMVSGVRDHLSDVVEVASRIPYAIQVAVGYLGNLLYQAGRNVVSGLMNGIASRVSALRNQMYSIASTIRGAFPFSPAKYGPLRIHPPEEAGENITRLLAEGLERGQRIVADATSSVAAAAVVEPDTSMLPTEGIGAQVASAEAQAALMAQVLEAIRERRGDIVLQVDSQEIARATARGERQLARR